jgi:hypothetical protein
MRVARFNKDKEPIAWTLVELLVVEVSADTPGPADPSGPLRILRASPELSPSDVILPDRILNSSVAKDRPVRQVMPIARY